VKGLALVARDEILLGEDGVADDRRFYLVDENGRKLNQKDCGELVQVQPTWDGEAETLSFVFPDGSRVSGTVELGEAVRTEFYGRTMEGRLVAGPWSDALSEFAGRPIRLVWAAAPVGGVDRGPAGAMTLLSTASLRALGDALGNGATPDARRFRMLIGVDGCEPHEEDGWVGREIRIGDAVVRPLGNVGRCAVTTQNPETGVPDLGTLKALAAYREDGTEPLPFGVHGAVVASGPIRLGDAVEPV
jgi:uncharacterized protein